MVICITTMSEIEELDCQLASGDYYIKESDQLLTQYRAAKTEHAKQRLIPKMKAIYGKLAFQKKEIAKYIPPELWEEFNINE